MITNATELQVAVRNMKIMEEALRALREQLEIANPRLLEMTSKTYRQRISALQRDIVHYLAQYPAEISLILPPLDFVVPSR